MTDTSPAALRKLARRTWTTTSYSAVIELHQVLLAIAVEKGAQHPRHLDAGEFKHPEFRTLRASEVMLAYLEFDRAADESWNNAEYLNRFGEFVSMKTVEVNVAQHHCEQPLEMVAPADVPLPEPYDHIHEWDTPLYVERDLDSAPKNGRPPNRSIPVFTTKQFLLGRDAYANAKVAAERERCIGEVSALYEEIKSDAGRHPDSYQNGKLVALDIAEQRIKALDNNQKGSV